MPHIKRNVLYCSIPAATSKILLSPVIYLEKSVRVAYPTLSQEKWN